MILVMIDVGMVRLVIGEIEFCRLILDVTFNILLESIEFK